MTQAVSIAQGGVNNVTFRNAIINGGMAIAQRGTTYGLTAGVLYGSVDRFAFYQSTSANGVANQVVAGLNGFQYALKLGRNSGATTTGALALFQALETVNSIQFQSQPITLSFWAKAGANFSASGSSITVQVLSGTGTDQSVGSIYSWTGSTSPISTTQVITNGWVRYSFTGTVSSTATQLGLTVFYTPTGTAGADDNLYITGVQLEAGTTATPFEQRLYGTELSLCQRYFYMMANGVNIPLGIVAFNSTADLRGCIWFPVPMRSTPSLSVASGASYYRVYNGTVNNGFTSFTSDLPSNVSYGIGTATGLSGATAGAAAALLTNNASAQVSFSSEL